MDTEATRVTQSYLEHLGADDVALVRAAADAPPGGEQAPVDELLGDLRVRQALFGGAGAAEPLLGVSPFLMFAVAVHGVADNLGSMTYVTEWLGPHLRAPVFDVEPLRDFLHAPRRRLFLAELLASYTHVASGSVLVATRRGLRRHRFSELDPVRLAGLLEVVPEADRPGILRRLGDLSLFLTGVFPDQVANRGFGPIEEARLRRAGAATVPVGGPAADGEWLGIDRGGAVGLLERLGRRWYRAAYERMGRPVPVELAVIGELPGRFDHARRILNLVTDQFLFARREQWFGLGSS